MNGRHKTALIFGVSGQDGAYLAKLLIDQGHVVHGTSRDRELANLVGLEKLGIRDKVHLHSAVVTEFRSVLHAIAEVLPSQIYNLAAQSSVGLSFEQPVETIDSIMHGTINILEAARFLKLGARVYNASSGECFGDTANGPADEATPFRPRSPYAVAKAASFWAVANYREAYSMFASSGLMFNHESPLRPVRYVTQKIIRGAADVAERKIDVLRLGNLDISRDWGWAPEYVDAAVRMLEQDSPEDMVIATGEMHSLKEFVDHAFRYFGLRWSDHVQCDPGLFRPSDVSVSVGNPTRARLQLGWIASIKMPTIVERLADAEMLRRRTDRHQRGEAQSPQSRGTSGRT